MTEESPATKNLVRKIVNRTSELTPLKTVATKAIQLAEDETSAAMDLATVLSSDQALTAKLLKLSNSAYYGYAREISNVREAVILLGMKTVRSVAIASTIIESFKTPKIEGFSEDLLWAHSAAVGLVAEAIARETHVAQPEDAFTAGVLHDMGKLSMMLAETTRFKETIRLVHEEGMNYGEAELLAFDGVSHAHVGARLARRWRFPAELVGGISAHHPERIPRRLETLGDVVAAANLACNREGIACGFDWTLDEDRKYHGRLPVAAQEAIDNVHGGMETLANKARTFLQHVSSGSPIWYAGLGGVPANHDDEVAGSAESAANAA